MATDAFAVQDRVLRLPERMREPPSMRLHYKGMWQLPS